ncbi:MAG: hypothetical protein HUJ52_00050 [Malacoplasma sp.]|nr:hypothetical protein [Malacoplasma sp.]
MKKIKLITSLSTLTFVATATPIVATSCSEFKGFIKAIDGTNLWVTQPGDIKLLMPMGIDYTRANNVVWTIKDAKSLKNNIEILDTLNGTSKTPFGFLHIKPTATVPKESETIVVHAENSDQTFSADAKITIRSIGTTAPYSVQIDHVDQTDYKCIKKISDPVIFALFDKDGVEADKNWQWTASTYFDPSGKISELRFITPTIEGSSILKAIYDEDPDTPVTAICTAVNSLTQARLTYIVIFSAPTSEVK